MAVAQTSGERIGMTSSHSVALYRLERSRPLPGLASVDRVVLGPGRIDGRTLLGPDRIEIRRTTLLELESTTSTMNGSVTGLGRAMTRELSIAVAVLVPCMCDRLAQSTTDLSMKTTWPSQEKHT